jgi:hypothetical protein
MACWSAFCLDFPIRFPTTQSRDGNTQFFCGFSNANLCPFAEIKMKSRISFLKPALGLRFCPIKRKIAEKSHALARRLKETEKSRKAGIHILGFLFYDRQI